jgi:hypothetical protein
MRKNYVNSVIKSDESYEEPTITDLSLLGASNKDDRKLMIYELNNGFNTGDALYYDYTSGHYRRAIAVNTILSEVVGVVGKVIDKDNFELVLKGDIETNKFDLIPDDSPLYLSPLITGKLIPNEPNNISKVIAIKKKYGLIKVDIQRGYSLIDEKIDSTTYSDARFYTTQEIKEITNQIISDIYDIEY